MIRTIIVDDSNIFLESVEYYLSTFPYVQVVDKATSGSEAIEKIDKYKPDLVLMDIDMPEMNGLEATRHVKMQPDSPFIIIVSYHNGNEYKTLAIDAGADGFISKVDFALNVMPLIDSMFLFKKAAKQ
ncbi:MAG: response regulator transcription factor [Proteobacteria bacterium]|nr:response regulator transcription factor [Pseudomonadota bacterium]